MSPVVVHRNQSGRTETTRKPVSARPSVGGSTHSRHAGRISAICGADAFSRVQGIGRRRATTGYRSLIFFFGNARFQLRQKSPRCIAQALHQSTSCHAVGTHKHLITGASACPNQGGANPHRNGANP